MQNIVDESGKFSSKCLPPVGGINFFGDSEVVTSQKAGAAAQHHVINKPELSRTFHTAWTSGIRRAGYASFLQQKQ